MLSSRFGMAITITHFHICTQSAPEHASQNSSTPKGRSFKAPPLSEMLLAITTTGEGRIILPQGSSLWYHVLMNGPMPIHIWAALNGLIGCLKRENMKFGGKYVGRRFRSCMGKDMIIIHCIHV